MTFEAFVKRVFSLPNIILFILQTLTVWLVWAKSGSFLLALFAAVSLIMANLLGFVEGLHRAYAHVNAELDEMVKMTGQAKQDIEGLERELKRAAKKD